MRVIDILSDRQNKANLPCSACSVPVRAFGIISNLRFQMVDWVPDGKPQSATRRKRLTASLRAGLCAEQSQFSRGMMWPQVLHRKEVMMDSVSKRVVKNKANFARPRQVPGGVSQSKASRPAGLFQRLAVVRGVVRGARQGWRAGTLAIRRARGQVFALFIRRRWLHLGAFGVGRQEKTVCDARPTGFPASIYRLVVRS